MNGVEKIDSLIQHLQTFEERLETAVREALEENQTSIIDYNIYAQLYDLGINSEGKSIKPKYHPITIRVKLEEREPPQPVDRVTLRDTGDFAESFYIIFNDDSFQITSSDYKTSRLVRKYGDEIFGLTEEHMAEVVNNFIKPKLLFELKNVKQ